MLVACVILALLLLLLLLLVVYLELESTCHAAVVTTELSNSDVRCKPSSYSSGACGSFVTARGCLHQILVLHRAHSCCELRAAGRVYFLVQKTKRHVPTYLYDTPCSLFVDHPGVGNQTLMKSSHCGTKPAAGQIVRHVTDGPAPTLKNRLSPNKKTCILHSTILPYKYGNPISRIVGTSGEQPTISPTNNSLVTQIVPTHSYSYCRNLQPPFNCLFGQKGASGSSFREAVTPSY